MELPDSLVYKMELFRERGTVVNYRDGMFLEPSWLAVYFGQNIFPRRHDPLSAKVPDPVLGDAFRSLASRYRAAAEAMPPHQAFLDRYAAEAAGH